MNSEKEVLLFTKEFPFRLFHACGRINTIPLLHWHDCLELNFVRSGTGTNIISDTQYEMKSGQIYIINNNEHHYAFSDGPLDILVMVFEPFFIWQNTTFDYEYLKPFFERNINFCNLIDVDNPFVDQIKSLMEEIEKEYVEQSPGYRLIIKSSLMKILALLYRHFKLEGQIGNELLVKQREFERIRDAVAYIDQHYTEDLNISDISKLVFMNSSYFSTCFKKAAKVNVMDYILSLRINHAAKLLRETNQSITEIALECGFYSSAYFTRSFKRMTKLTPTNYRNINVDV